MKLTKKYLEVLYQVLHGTDGQLSLQEARIRDGFMKPVFEALKTFEDDRYKIYVKFCNKDKEGKPDLTDNLFHFEPKVAPKMQKEMDILYGEEVELPEPKFIKVFIERTQYKPKAGEVALIDEMITKL